MWFSYGKNITVQVFGQSHSQAIGAVIDGLPAGESVDMEAVRAFMARRAPGRSDLSTARRETDEPEVVSGMLDGQTTGDPVCALIHNKDAHSQDYAGLRFTPRPGHSDWPAFVKFAGKGDIRGGGAFSGRLTAPLCFAGAICSQLLLKSGIEVFGRIASVGHVTDDPIDWCHPDKAQLRFLRDKELAVLSDDAEKWMRLAIQEAAAEGDSVGGVVECIVTGLPPGIGGHMFMGVENRIAQAVFGIPGVKGIEFGNGFESSTLRGSKNNDPYLFEGEKVVTQTNNHGGVLGGMTTGMPLVFRVALKPTASIAMPQNTVDLITMRETEISVGGRHDPCIVPRAVPAVEAVAAIVALDIMFDHKGNKA